MKLYYENFKKLLMFSRWKLLIFSIAKHRISAIGCMSGVCLDYWNKTDNYTCYAYINASLTLYYEDKIAVKVLSFKEFFFTEIVNTFKNKLTTQNYKIPIAKKITNC